MSALLLVAFWTLAQIVLRAHHLLSLASILF